MQALPWIVALVALVLLGASLAGWPSRWGPRRERAAALPTEWDLASRPVFSSDERRLYRLLREALPHHVLLPKLPLLRFCHPTDPSEAAYWRGLLGTIQVGFAICSENGRVLTAIDLDVERRPSRRESRIKREVLSACRVRYLRCAVDQLPSIAELQLLVPRSAGQSTASHPPDGWHRRADTRPAPTARPATRPGFWHEPPAFHDSFFDAAERPADASRDAFSDDHARDESEFGVENGRRDVRGPRFAAARRR